MFQSKRSAKGFIAGGLVGTLGGLIGLGGAEFRLPVLVGVFKLPTLEAIILNKAMSLVVVMSALVFRLKSVPLELISQHAGISLNLLGGSLIGAWWAAGHAMRMSRAALDKIIMVLLVGLALTMFAEAWHGLGQVSATIFNPSLLIIVVGVLAGFGIGVVAALLGVAGGELLIPTIVLLYGVDIKLAGSLSLAVSLPTMIVGFARYTQSDAFKVLRQEKRLLLWMSLGSIIGAAIGGALLGLVSTRFLMLFLAAILLISAVKTFQHSNA